MARILVVDDHIEFREVLGEALEQRGHEVVVAADGNEALRCFLAEPPDLVITDILMPDRDGLEVILELRKKAPDIPVIAVSSGGQIGADTVLRSAEAFGASRVFRKPFDFDELFAAMDELLKPR